jgi:hypothetical protein
MGPEFYEGVFAALACVCVGIIGGICWMTARDMRETPNPPPDPPPPVPTPPPLVPDDARELFDPHTGSPK